MSPNGVMGFDGPSVGSKLMARPLLQPNHDGYFCFLFWFGLIKIIKNRKTEDKTFFLEMVSSPG